MLAASFVGDLAQYLDLEVLKGKKKALVQSRLTEKMRDIAMAFDLNKVYSVIHCDHRIQQTTSIGNTKARCLCKCYL